MLEACRKGGGNWRHSTYNTEGSDEDTWRGVVCCIHLGDEVGSHADDGDEAHGLHNPDDGESHTQRSISRCRNFESSGGASFRRIELGLFEMRHRRWTIENTVGDDGFL